MYIGKQKTPLGALEKKVPRNPKYANVRASLDTGASVSKVKHITTKEFLARQKELFQRLSCHDLAEVLDVRVVGCTESLREEDESKNQINQDLTNGFKSAFAASRPVHQGGPIGDYSRDRNIALDRAAEQRDQDQQQDVLLLDLRDLGDWQKCHIHGATSYPAVNIAQDRLTPSMHRFKNKAGKLVVLYDDDEKIAACNATCLVQRGFENVRVLSGGLRSFGNAYGHLLQGGPLPEQLVKKKVVSPTESTAHRREERRRRRQEQEMLQQQEGLSPRFSYYAGSVSGASSVVSSVSHRSSFSRAPRWKDDRAAAQEHRERVAKLHHTVG